MTPTLNIVCEHRYWGLYTPCQAPALFAVSSKERDMLEVYCEEHLSNRIADGHTYHIRVIDDGQFFAFLLDGMVKARKNGDHDTFAGYRAGAMEILGTL